MALYKWAMFEDGQIVFKEVHYHGDPNNIYYTMWEESIIISRDSSFSVVLLKFSEEFYKKVAIDDDLLLSPESSNLHIGGFVVSRLHMPPNLNIDAIIGTASQIDSILSTLAIQEMLT